MHRRRKNLGVHVSQLRNWVKGLADDQQRAFPGHGQMKPEQQEIFRLPASEMTNDDTREF